jgi:hypothetical protein
MAGPTSSFVVKRMVIGEIFWQREFDSAIDERPHTLFMRSLKR